MWSRADPGVRTRVSVTAAAVLGLVFVWLAVYSIGILGALWRLREPDAPPPILSASDQIADLVMLVSQFGVGVVAVAATLLIRRHMLKAVLPARRGSAADAAIAWCAAIAASSAMALLLDRLEIARFDLSVPAVVESPWLAVLSAVSTGLREEPLLAALPVLLLVGRLPIGWIMILAGTMRGVLYLYFGSGGFLWAFVWGAAAVWVYYRYRRLWVLVLVHGLVMNIQALDRIFSHESAATVLQWANILILFGALTWWLMPRALDSVLTGGGGASSNSDESSVPPATPRDTAHVEVNELPHIPAPAPAPGPAVGP